MKTFLLSLFAMATSVLAIPQLVNYQGQLSSPTGTPLDTTVAMTFRLYSLPSGGTSIWTETHSTVVVSDGLFNALLGSVAALPDSFSVNRWLGITIGADTEMNPRYQLVSVAHAYRVGTVDGASGGTVTGDVNIAGKANIGSGNVNSGNFAFVAGQNDTASGEYSTISGGWFNSATAIGATVGGGSANVASGGGATVGGGAANLASNYRSTIAGGQINEASGNYSTIGGGTLNTASDGATTVGGGYGNAATQLYATVIGGQQCQAGGNSSIAGGDSVLVFGDHSVGFGQKITCNSDSAFVFSDGTEPFVTGADRTASFLTTGGFRIWTAAPVANNIGTRLTAGGTSWVALSDSTTKENRRDAHGSDVLQKIADMPIDRWNYKHQDENTEHIGPMAQDFWNAFHLGSDSLGIETIDADGVLFAAVQELAKQLAVVKEENTELKQLMQQMIQLGHK